MDDSEKAQIEKVVLLHLDMFSKTLLEIKKEICSELYSILDARRLAAMQMDKEIKIK